MPDLLTLVSTTDSPEEVQAALTGTPVPTSETPPATEPPAGDPPPPPATEPPAGETPPEPPPPDDKPPVGETPEQQNAREKRKSKFQLDIDALTRRKHDLRRDVEAEEARLETLKRELTNLVVKPVEKPAEPPAAAPAPVAVTPDRPQPQLADVDPATGNARYANYEEWVADLTAWNREVSKKEYEVTLETRLKADRDARDQEAADERARIERASANRAVNESLAKHNTTIEEFKKTHADFDALLDDVSALVVEMKSDYHAATGRPGEHLFGVLDKFTLEDSQNGAALVYHLAQHPDEVRRIVQLPPAQQLIALTRIDSRLEGAAPPQPGPPSKVTSTTKAPEPIKPVGGGPTAPSTVAGENETYADYKARRDREERVRLGLPAK